MQWKGSVNMAGNRLIRFKLLLPAVILMATLTAAGDAQAAWLGFRNDTSTPLSIQISTGGRIGASITLNPGETTWNFVPDDSVSNVVVSNSKMAVLVRFETTVVTRQTDVLYAIQPAGTDRATAQLVPGAKKGK